MSLQRRLLLYLLLCAPLVWGCGLAFAIKRARHEINELYDTQLIRLARQVQATLPATQPVADTSRLARLPAKGDTGTGEADLRDLATAVWDRNGTLSISDREGVQIRYRPQAVGFVEDEVDGRPWRIYYLQSFDGTWLVAAGQKTREREELVLALTVNEAIRWVVVLPLLLLVMAWAVRRALAPLKQLSADLGDRSPNDLHALHTEGTPAELKPLVSAVNGLFLRIESMLARERRFTADAAHELRTPLATLRFQWDSLRSARNESERQAAEDRLERGLQRMDRVVTQMLALSRVESIRQIPHLAPVDWTQLVEQVINDCVSLADRRSIELSCEWPPYEDHPWNLNGSSSLLAVLFRNLMDNAVRYAPVGSAVTLRIGVDQVSVENEGPPIPDEVLKTLGTRFSRPDGQSELGSGLGLSIAYRVAELHGLNIQIGPKISGHGVVVTVKARSPQYSVAPATGEPPP